jgi:predicted ABC-type ATPase
MCIPAPLDTPGLNPLSDQELISTMDAFGDPRYAADVARFKNGQISREKLARREAVNKTEDGKNAFIDHRAEGHVKGNLPGNLPGQLADDIAGSQAGLADPTKVTTTSEHYAADGVYSPERALLHDEIAAEYLHSGLAATGEGETLYFMGGGPASGKSSMVKALKNPRLGPGRKNLFIDSDEIKKFLPEYNSLVTIKDPGAAAFAHAESSVISKRILNEGAERGIRSITLDGVGDRGLADIIKKVKTARDAGYTIEANYATLDTNLAVKLAKNRARETGRLVPESYVRSAHADVSATFFDAVEAKVFDVANLYDTSIQGKPKLIFRMVHGKGEILDEDLLKNFLAKGGTRTLGDVKQMIQ